MINEEVKGEQHEEGRWSSIAVITGQQDNDGRPKPKTLTTRQINPMTDGKHSSLISDILKGRGPWEDESEVMRKERPTEEHYAVRCGIIGDQSVRARGVHRNRIASGT